VGGLLVCSRQDRTPLRLASGVVFGPPKPRSVLPRRCAYAPGWSPLPHARPGAPHSLDLRSSTATRRGAAPPHRRTSMAHQDWRGPPNHPASRLADIPQRVRDAFNARRRVGAAGECWPYGNNQTYGNVQWRDDDGTKRRIAAHRLALMLRTGEDVPAGALVLHSCDTPACTNWRHLRIGDHRQNQLDAVARGRWVYTPPRHPRSRSCDPVQPTTAGA